MESFSFASEIKSLFVQPGITPEFSPEGLKQIYTFWTTITPNTAFKNIFELSPGEFLIYSRRGIEIEKYWELNFDLINSSISMEEAANQFDILFSDSVKIRLRADVEVAAYLSGGIGSRAKFA